MVTIKVMSGIGNQLFQYAYALYLKKKGIDVQIDISSWYTLSDARSDRKCQLCNLNISIPIADMYTGFWKKAFKNLEKKENLWYWLALHRVGIYQIYVLEDNPESYISPRKLGNRLFNYYISGYFQNYRIPRAVKASLLHEIELKTPLILNEYMKSLLLDDTVATVSLHIRRGDYLREKRLSPCSMEYYLRAMGYMESHYKNVYYCIFSDDLAWVKESEIINSRYILVNEERQYSDLEELFLMSKCNHHIIANSTFSWWGAWLDNKKNKTVIAPKKWFNYELHPKIYPKEWIKL